MTTFYLDFEGGNDANDGTTFANRWKTFNAGATALRLAAGDTIRVMASAEETLVGNATWTQGSKTVALNSAVTSAICDCESIWTGSANITQTADAAIFKENSKSAKSVAAAGFTTGLMAFFATGMLDLSAYQQVSFWIRTNVTTANTLSLRLCSDVAGLTTVHTIPVPQNNAPNSFMAVTVDLGSAMSSSIQSVALYADLDPGGTTTNLDNIIACKAPSNADALSLTSLIGKIWNLCWLPSTIYAANDIRRPTQPNRNGFIYKVTAGGGGTSGAIEPTWPTVFGQTVVDGSLTWSCEELEETWYPIQSIAGTTVKLDNGVATLGSAGRGYQGSTETVATYKREAIPQTTVSGTTNVNALLEVGTDVLPVTYIGGWNRADMSTQTGETWLSGKNSSGRGFVLQNGHNVLSHINGCRYASGAYSSAIGSLVKNCHFVGCGSAGIEIGTNSPGMVVRACNTSNNAFGLSVTNGSASNWRIYRTAAHNNTGSGYSNTSSNFFAEAPLAVMHTYNNGAYGVHQTPPHAIIATGFKSKNNTSGGVNASAAASRHFFRDSNIQDATVFVSIADFYDSYIYSHNHNQTTDNHLITTDGGTIISATDQRHTASGVSWKFKPTSTNRTSVHPLKLSVSKVAVSANSLVTVSIWTYRDSTNINGTLKVHGGQIAGVPENVTVACAPSINTWVQSSNLTFTPTEDGVVEVTFECYDGAGTTNNFWVDDISISQ